MAAEPAKVRRTATREARREQLIEATMKCIGRKGLGSMTLADVANEAGLSQGIVNLHFQSKDNLLTETLKSLANEYQAKFERTLARSGANPAGKIQALLELDLKPSVCDRRKLAVWFAFWGEVKSRPTYRKICDDIDQYYDDVMIELCQAVIDEGEYRGVTAEAATEALTSMTNGLWLSALISPQTWDRDLALEAIRSYLRSVFPKHFS